MGSVPCCSLNPMHGAWGNITPDEGRPWLSPLLSASTQARLKFPIDYPYSPPAFRFLTKMWHPNIYEVSLPPASVWWWGTEQALCSPAGPGGH